MLLHRPWKQSFDRPVSKGRRGEGIESPISEKMNGIIYKPNEQLGLLKKSITRTTEEKSGI